jgi:hypothetical protein
MFPAPFAMTVARSNEWRINLKPHAATQTTPANALAHSRLSSSNYQLSTLGDNANYADENGFAFPERQAMRCPCNIARPSPTKL